MRHDLVSLARRRPGGGAPPSGCTRRMPGVVPYPLLSRLESPSDLRRLPLARLPALAAELRAFLLQHAATDVRHLTAELGTVELAVAVHYVFETPADRIVWDGGEQTSAHKVLTCRRERLHTIGQPGGLQPFPHRAESAYDAFGVGHASTAISAALGMAVAAAHSGATRQVVAILGAKALTGGEAFEALNHAGSLGADLLKIPFSRTGRRLPEMRKGCPVTSHGCSRAGCTRACARVARKR